MTPYELADLLQTTKSTNNQAANMLRQQADRIAELEKETKNWNSTVGGKKAISIPCPDGIEGCLVAHYKIIETPQTNAEPVAWMPIKSKQRMTEIKPDENDLHNWIPLYTTPQTKLNAKKRYDKCMKGKTEPNPVERLRFFLSCALSGQDWIDVEPFINAVTPQTKPLTDEEISAVWHSGEFLEEAIDGNICAIHYNKFARDIEAKILGETK